MADLQTSLNRWKYARSVSDRVQDWLRGLENTAKTAALTLFNTTPPDTRKAQILPGVQVREEIVVTLDEKTGEAAALVMGNILTYSNLVTLNSDAIMTLVGMIYSGKYPELQAAMILDERAYKDRVKKSIEKHLAAGKSLEEAVKLVNMPADSITVKQTVAFSVDNIQTTGAEVDATAPFIFLSKAAELDPSDLPPF